VLKAELDDYGFCEKYGASVQEHGPYQCDSIGHGWNLEPKTFSFQGPCATIWLLCLSHEKKQNKKNQDVRIL